MGGFGQVGPIVGDMNARNGREQSPLTSVIVRVSRVSGVFMCFRVTEGTYCLLRDICLRNVYMLAPHCP
jgi:hypothetical protein